MVLGIILIVLVIVFIVWGALRNTPDIKAKKGSCTSTTSLHNFPKTTPSLMM